MLPQHRFKTNDPYFLQDKFLVTGADTLTPRPQTPHPSKEAAIDRAKQVLTNADNQQRACIVWVPLLVVAIPQPVFTLTDLSITKDLSAL